MRKLITILIIMILITVANVKGVTINEISQKLIGGRVTRMAKQIESLPVK